MDAVAGDTIVTRESATKIAELSRTCGFHKNHINLVEPAGMNDPVYQVEANAEIEKAIAARKRQMLVAMAINVIHRHECLAGTDCS